MGIDEIFKNFKNKLKQEYEKDQKMNQIRAKKNPTMIFSPIKPKNQKRKKTKSPQRQKPKKK